MSAQTGLRRLGHALVAIGTFAFALAALRYWRLWELKEHAEHLDQSALLGFPIALAAGALAWIVYGFAGKSGGDS